MSTMFVRTALLATLALSITACNRESATSGAAADGPQQALQKSIALTREGDIGGLIEHMLPPEEFTRIKADWTSEKDQPPIDDAARARFAETMSKLTAPDAAEVLFKEFEPDIRQFDTQYQQQMPTMVAMGRSYLKGVVQQNQELSVGEKEQATQIIEALATWALKNTDSPIPSWSKQTLAVVTDAARQLDLKSLDEARGLDFEQSAPKLKIAFNSLKKVLALYGFSIDQTLDSATTELVSSTADEAVVKVSYKLLDTPFQANVDMVRVGERWYNKDTIEKLKARNAEKAMATATPAAANG